MSPRMPRILEVGPTVFVRNPDRLDERVSACTKERKHLWVYSGLWETRDPLQRQGVHLDTENLLGVEGPGCFICEQMWSREVAAEPCPGAPA